MVADIGNETMNVMYIIDKKPIEEKCWTEKLSTNECMIKAVNAVMEETGPRIEPATVERVLRFNAADDIDFEFLGAELMPTCGPIDLLPIWYQKRKRRYQIGSTGQRSGYPNDTRRWQIDTK